MFKEDPSSIAKQILWCLLWRLEGGKNAESQHRINFISRNRHYEVRRIISHYHRKDNRAREGSNSTRCYLDQSHRTNAVTNHVKGDAGGQNKCVCEGIPSRGPISLCLTEMYQVKNGNPTPYYKPNG